MNSSDSKPENESDPATSDPKIIVDDDWKSQVQREKEELKEKMAAEPTDSDIPDASFPMLVTTMATQALANLGQLPDPIENKPVIRKPLAKHFIDTLDMLEQKTKGNLNDQELGLLSETLHQLRMVFVNTPDKMPDPPGDQPTSSTIEIPS